MDIVRLSISKPVTVAVGVILVLMFGMIGVGSIPIQLSPNVDRPTIEVRTNWPGRSPDEIVNDIVKEQEERLKNVDNLKRMKSSSREGFSTITLEFYLGADIDRAKQDVADALRQVPEYPDDVDPPTVIAKDGASENAIAWIIIDVDPAKASSHPDFDITTLFQPLEDEVKPYLARIDGVAEVNVYGGRQQEVRVLLNPVRMAQRNITHVDVMNALRSENRNVSAGTITQGKRDYRVRVMGQFESPEDVLNTVVAYRSDVPTYLSDIGEVEMGYQKQRGFVRSLGYPSIAINVIRQTGANVMDVMEELRARLDEVETEILPNLAGDVGPDLRLRQVYDETIYISSAIELVQGNLWIGGVLAACVLMLFLRSVIATGVIALAIPISVVGTFLVLLALGRSLNVISLAGLAFAVGMVVDNAIVVLENIHRHLHMGKPRMQAAYEGGREVWGAILASTLTTVAVFVPILTVQEEAGQLFRDISIAIVASVTLSLVVSITVIPAACSRWLRDHDASSHGRVYRLLDSLFGLVPLCHGLTIVVSRVVHWLITGWRGWTIRPLVILVMTAASLLGAWALMPPMDYLPAGNRNLVFGGMQIPPGLSVDQMKRNAEMIESVLRPYVEVDPEDSSEVAQLPPIPKPFAGPGEAYAPVPVENFFIGSFDGGMFVGATSWDPDRVKPIGALVNKSIQGLPDTFGGASQASLFGRGVGGANAIDIEVTGPDLDRVVTVAAAIQQSLVETEQYDFTKVQATPGNFRNPQQEYRVRITPAGTELGLRPDNIGVVVRALFDGAFVGDFKGLSQTIDIRLLPREGRLEGIEALRDLPVATPSGRIVPLDTLVEVTPALAQQEIQRIEELPSVTINVTPPDGEPLELAMRDIQENHIEKARQQGLIDRTMRIRLEGTAAKLDEVRTALIGAAPTPGAARAGWQVAGGWIAWGVGVVGVLVGALLLVRAIVRRDRSVAYGSFGALCLGLLVGGLILAFTASPELTTARFIWALVVTYLLMCSLFESFIYPLVIMFTVPLAIVGGFVGLKIVHEYTAGHEMLSTQNLDVLTMLGFVILVGVVVNNAILIVHQSLNMMRGDADSKEIEARGEPLPPREAIPEAVRTRIRPVFMSTMTSVGGMLPLVLFPGSGSELYRGLGSVVVGGLLMSTIFTLLLVPLLFSLLLDMTEGVQKGLRRRSRADEAGRGAKAGAKQPEKAATKPEREPEPALAE